MTDNALHPEPPEPQVSDSSSRQSRWVTWGLGLLLLVTFALRVWNSSAGLDASRYFDERFSLRNVEMILVDGSTQPANAFYGSLSYLPQTLGLWISEQLYALTGNETFAIFNDRAADGWSRTAYFITRLVCAIFGTLSVWLTFLLGRRLFDPRAGLLGAALLSAFPRHILASTEFKPDILVVLLVVLTFSWSLDVVQHRTLRNFLWAGAGVGLAVAAKYTGVGVAIPLTVGVLYLGWRERRTWMWLIGAGVASIATFALLNIHLAVIIEYLPRIWRIMETKGDATGGSRWDVLGQEFAFLLRHHRWPVLIFAILGCGGMLRRAIAPVTEFGTTVREGILRRVAAIMVLSYIFGYSALYAGATKLFKGQNYLPVAAFTSILAAWVMVELWDRLALRLPLVGRWPVAAPLWTAFLLYAFAFPFDIVYHDVVPSTQKLAERQLSQQLRPLELRHVIAESLGERSIKASTPGGHWLMAVPVERLSDVTSRQLDGSDAEIFLAERLTGSDTQTYLRRATRPAAQSLRFEPHWFKAHGPPLAVLFHPWKLDGEPRPVELETAPGNQFVALGERPDDWQATSLAIWMPLHTGANKPRRVIVEGQELPLWRTRRGGKRAHYITPRFILGRTATATPEPIDDASDGGATNDEATPGDLVITFDESLRLDWTPEVRVVRWVP